MKPRHVTTGEKLGHDGEIIDVRMKCRGCQATQTEPIDPREPIAKAVADVSCLWCGAVGRMRLVAS